MKSDLPANFLLYLRSGDLTISDGDGTAIEFSSKGRYKKNKHHTPTYKNSWENEPDKAT